MHRELVFTAHPGNATPAKQITLAEAGLKERSDLQEWIRQHPQILGPGVRIVAYEFDKWISTSGTHADRLDLLGLDEDSRLVLAELKRDAAPDTVEMQAIKYASYASQFSVETLASCHGDYLRKTLNDPTLTDEDALSQLDEHCGGLDPTKFPAVRIVLIAGSFPKSVTSAVTWLCTQGELDISLLEIGSYKAENDLIVTVSQLWPLPDLADLTVSPTSSTSALIKQSGARKRISTNAVTVLVDSDVIPDGTLLRVDPHGSAAEGVKQWVAEKPERGVAVWRGGERIKVLEWQEDSLRYSASGLAEHISKLATGKDHSLNGTDWWVLGDETPLSDLGGTSRQLRHGWEPLHQLLQLIPAGAWTTYGDLAEALKRSPIPIKQHLLAGCAECAHTYRVLGDDYRPQASALANSEGGTKTSKEELEKEGVTFDPNGAADNAKRLQANHLLALSPSSSHPH